MQRINICYFQFYGNRLYTLNAKLYRKRTARTCSWSRLRLWAIVYVTEILAEFLVTVGRCWEWIPSVNFNTLVLVKLFHVLLVRNMQTKLNKIKCVVSHICKFFWCHKRHWQLYQVHEHQMLIPDSLLKRFSSPNILFGFGVISCFLSHFYLHGQEWSWQKLLFWFMSLYYYYFVPMPRHNEWQLPAGGGCARVRSHDYLLRGRANLEQVWRNVYDREDERRRFSVWFQSGIILF